MLKPRNLLILFILILSFSWFSSSGIWKRTKAVHFNSPEKKRAISNSTFEALKVKVEEAKIFIKNKSYNEQICFLIDMSLPSGQNRFFVYDLKKDTIKNAGVVTHGRCNQNWLEGRKYSNEPGCGCTSLGKYKIANSYYGRFGLAYKLHGLDKTNSNAFKRFVVLHSHECVPETEIKDDICQSDGCPTVAPGYLQQLKPIIDESTKPVLLWIYE
ncbi:MAG: peptidase [Bacteroidetes bacterium]|nr:MAG: peptidase [Bacteroidota bacterium]